MNVLEFFAGTASFSNVCKLRGHNVRTLDCDPQFKCTYTMNVMDFDPKILGNWKPDIIWASIPCDCFSVVNLSANWTGGEDAYIVKSPHAKMAIRVAKKTLSLISDLNPTFYIIENPRGMLRKMPFMQDYHRDTITYCQYGERRMKPTDLWHNLPDFKARSCTRLAKCHTRSPRGTRTGTQKERDPILKSMIPVQLCNELLDVCEQYNILYTTQHLPILSE